MEAEARAILVDACSEGDEHLEAADLQSFIDQLYGDRKPTGVVEEFIEQRRREAARE